MKKANNFQIVKAQPLDVALLVLDFFANFSQALLIKKACISEDSICHDD